MYFPNFVGKTVIDMSILVNTPLLPQLFQVFVTHSPEGIEKMQDFLADGRSGEKLPVLAEISEKGAI